MMMVMMAMKKKSFVTYIFCSWEFLATFGDVSVAVAAAVVVVVVDFDDYLRYRWVNCVLTS